MIDHTPLPWKHAESKGGKWFIYDAFGKPVYVRNFSSTNRSIEENKQIDFLIVKAVNNHDRLVKAIKDIKGWCPIGFVANGNAIREIVDRVLEELGVH